jgi:hypothetical protein
MPRRTAPPTARLVPHAPHHMRHTTCAKPHAAHLVAHCTSNASLRRQLGLARGRAVAFAERSSGRLAPCQISGCRLPAEGVVAHAATRRAARALRGPADSQPTTPDTQRSQQPTYARDRNARSQRDDSSRSNACHSIFCATSRVCRRCAPRQRCSAGAEVPCLVCRVSRFCLFASTVLKRHIVCLGGLGPSETRDRDVRDVLSQERDNDTKPAMQRALCLCVHVPVPHTSREPHTHHATPPQTHESCVAFLAF